MHFFGGKKICAAKFSGEDIHHIHQVDYKSTTQPRSEETKGRAADSEQNAEANLAPVSDPAWRFAYR
jgi:hypothetical protein